MFIPSCSRRGKKNAACVTANVWLRPHAALVPAHGGHVGAAGVSVPGAVGVPGQAALGAHLAVQLALVQAQLGDALPGAHKQPLLEGREGVWGVGGSRGVGGQKEEAEREKAGGAGRDENSESPQQSAAEADSSALTESQVSFAL